MRCFPRVNQNHGAPEKKLPIDLIPQINTRAIHQFKYSYEDTATLHNLGSMETLSVSRSSSSSLLVPSHFHGHTVHRAAHPHAAFGRNEAFTAITATATQRNRSSLHKTNAHINPNVGFNKQSPTSLAGTHLLTNPFMRKPSLSQVHVPPICALQGTEDSTIPEVTSATEGQVITCKAAVAWAAGEPLKIEEIQVAPPQAMEVRIKICYTSLCRTDLIFWQAKGQTPLFPRIFGHEAAGIVESVGEGVTDLKVGDHVLPVFTGECGKCKHCKSEESNMCDLLRINTDRVGMISDGKSRFSIGGKPIYHFLGTSTFSEYTVAHVGCVAKINPAAPLNRACILSCGVSTGMGATLNVGKPKKGSTVAIFGLGGVGLAAAEGARIAGASRIIGVDFNPGKFEKAKEFGVTEYVNPKEHQKPVQQVIAEMTDGGVDCSVECTGNVNAMIQAFESCHDGWGVAVLVGVPSSDATFSTNPVNFLNERTLRGTFFGNYKTKTDLPGLVEKYLNKELELDKFITSEIPFAEINKAFQYMIEGDGLRCVMKVQDE